MEENQWTPIENNGKLMKIVRKTMKNKDANPDPPKKLHPPSKKSKLISSPFYSILFYSNSVLFCSVVFCLMLILFYSLPFLILILIVMICNDGNCNSNSILA